MTWRKEGQVLVVPVVWAAGLSTCSRHTGASRVHRVTKPLLSLLDTVLTPSSPHGFLGTRGPCTARSQPGLA